MRTFLTILSIAFWTHPLDDTLFAKIQFLRHNNLTHCRTERDRLTKQIIYSTVDKEPENEGGQVALLREFNRIISDSLPDDLDTRFIIAFVVDPNGHISGERIIRDKIGNVGQQMIKIVKSFKWAPAECNGRKVSMLVKLPLQVCLQRN